MLYKHELSRKWYHSTICIHSVFKKMQHLEVSELLFLLTITAPLYPAQPLNLAALINGAACTASSSLTTNTTCEKALDALETPVEHEWVSAREGIGAFINIEFASLIEVHELRFLQGCNALDMVKEVTVEFDDGGSEQIQLSCDGGNSSVDCDVIHWEPHFFGTPIYTTSALITITQTCQTGGFVGFREIAAMGYIPEDKNSNVALIHVGGSCEASSIWHEYHATCDLAIDGNVTAYTNYVFFTDSTDPPSVVGQWLKLSFASLTEVTKLRIKNRCKLIHQVKTVSVQYDGGHVHNMSLDCNDGENANTCPEQVWDEVSVPRIRTKSIKITALELCVAETLTMSFQQVEVYGAPENSEPCPFGYDYVASLEACYLFGTTETALEHARSNCSSSHALAHLVRIDSDTEQDYLRRHLQQLSDSGVPCTEYLTDGYRDAPNDTDWFWASTGDQIYFTKFAVSPTADSLNITLSQQYMWAWSAVSGAGGDQYCYICEID